MQTKKKSQNAQIIRESKVKVVPIQDISHHWTFHKHVTKVTCPTNFLRTTTTPLCFAFISAKHRRRCFQKFWPSKARRNCPFDVFDVFLRRNENGDPPPFFFFTGVLNSLWLREKYIFRRNKPGIRDFIILIWMMWDSAFGGSSLYWKIFDSSVFF